MMTRKFLNFNEDGYGPRDRVFTNSHATDSCNDPITVEIMSELVPPSLRRNSVMNDFICLLFHSEHHRNRTDPDQTLRRFWLVSKLINAIERHHLQGFVEEAATESEIFSLESQLLQIQATIDLILGMTDRGKKRIAKEKADF